MSAPLAISRHICETIPSTPMSHTHTHAHLSLPPPRSTKHPPHLPTPNTGPMPNHTGRVHPCPSCAAAIGDGTAVHCHYAAIHKHASRCLLWARHRAPGMSAPLAISRHICETIPSTPMSHTHTHAHLSLPPTQKHQPPTTPNHTKHRPNAQPHGKSAPLSELCRCNW